jgi:hypothetical protein
MASSIKGVSIKVHPAFFDNIFERKRKRIQKKLHISNLSQMKFTEYLVKNNAKIRLPKKDKNLKHLHIKNPIRGKRFYV